MTDDGYCGSARTDKLEQLFRYLFEQAVETEEKRWGAPLSERQLRRIEREQRSQAELHFKLYGPKREADRREIQERERRLAEARRQERQGNWEKPRFGTPEYYQAISDKLISWEEAKRDQLEHEKRRQRAINSRSKRSPAPPRKSRPAPKDIGQYAMAMSTTPAYDQRLTPNAKVLLHVLRAMAGKKGHLDHITRAKLAEKMCRSVRSVQRYLEDLRDAGYIITKHVLGHDRMIIGLWVSITEKVLPPYARGEDSKSSRNPEGTKVSYKKGASTPPPYIDSSRKHQPIHWNQIIRAFASG